jgi:integrase
MEEPKKGWHRITSRAGLKNLRIHDLRRTMGSYQAIAGASLTIIGKSLGHKSPQSTAIYARLSNDPVRASMEAAFDFYNGKNF